MSDNFILIADIQKSRKIDPQAQHRLFQKIKKGLKEAREIQFHLEPVHSLGDELQASPVDLKSAIEAILFMEKVSLDYNLDVNFRYSLVQGELNHISSTKNIAEMSGAGLIKARSKIELLKSTEKYNDSPRNYGNVIIGFENSFVSNVLTDIFYYMFSIRKGWKVKYRKIAYAMLLEEDNSIVAGNFGYTYSAIWKRRKSMKIQEYLAMSQLIRNLIDEKMMQQYSHSLSAMKR